MGIKFKKKLAHVFTIYIKLLRIHFDTIEQKKMQHKGSHYLLLFHIKHLSEFCATSPVRAFTHLEREVLKVNGNYIFVLLAILGNFQFSVTNLGKATSMLDRPFHKVTPCTCFLFSFNVVPPQSIKSSYVCLSGFLPSQSSNLSRDP